MSNDEIKRLRARVAELEGEALRMREVLGALRESTGCSGVRVEVNDNPFRAIITGPVDQEQAVKVAASGLIAGIAHDAKVIVLERQVERLRALVAELEGEAARRDAPEPDGWLTITPDGLEWHGSRDDAEAFILDWFEGQLRDTGEGQDEEGYVLRVVAHTVEVVDATACDDTEAGEQLRDLRLDYLISGYVLENGAGGEG